MVPVLRHIVEHKRREVAESKRHVPLAELKERISELGRPRNFFRSVVDDRHPDAMRVIAEVKRKSPSAGVIREDFDPVAIARSYYEAGAAAISCLTDAEFFGGDLAYIHAIRDAVPLPVLRKDFIIDDYQVWEARAAGADAILLIAECLHEREIIDFQILATELQMTTILEVHSPDSLWRVVNHVGFPHAGYGLLGVNNRDLGTMRTDFGNALRIADMLEAPMRRVMVAESGIRSPDDMRRLHSHGVHIALVGESLMREPDPGAALRALLA
ncbi:MAG: indole-3-glycerol phosphate synthase TrpC [Planctomycetes bacterium]|nr:indole-3-glycerol phosphate synthase TrpC [Planctomycetota bacterium]